MVQGIIAGIIVLVAVYAAARHIIKTITKASKGESACDCCSSKGSCNSFKEKGGC